MGIGTSLGAHFENDFDLQAGKEYTPPEIKPKDELVDSNVVTPNQAAQDKQLNDIEMKELGGTPISMRIYPQKESEVQTPELPDVGEPLVPDGGQVSEGNNGLNAIFGTGDVERFKLWPERMLRDLINAAHKVSTGQVSMWSFDQNSGEFHTSIEGMEQAHALMPAILSGTLPGRISLDRSPGATGRVDLPPVTEENNTALREALNRIRRQPSNIQADTPVSPRQPVTRRAGEDDTSFALRTIEDVLSRPEETPGTPEFNTRYGYPENTGSQRLVNEEHELNIQSYADELYSIRNEHEDAGHGEWNPHGIRPGESYEAFARRNVDQPTGSRINPNDMPDREFYAWGEYQAENSMSVEQEARWLRIDQAEGERMLAGRPRPHQDDDGLGYADFLREEDPRADFEQQPFNHDDVQSWMEERAEQNKAVVEQVKKKFAENPDKVKTKGTISMMKEPGGSYSHHFEFISKDGVPGQMDITLRKGGKDLHVSWIGGVGGNRANDIGRSEMKNLFKLLADEFPQGEYVTGFRVSGVRGAIGRPSEAMMRIPGRGKTSE